MFHSESSKTQQMSTKQPLRAEADLCLRKALDSLAGRMAIIDSNGTVLFLNEAWKQTVLSGEEAAAVREGGDYFISCLPILCHDTALIGRVRLMVESLLTKRTNLFETEYRDVSNQGSRWYRLRLAPLFSKERDCVVITHEDITTELENREKLRNSEMLLRTILDAVHYRILLLDENMQVIWANKAATQGSGELLTELQGKSCRELCKPIHRCLACPAELALKTGEPHFSEVRTDKGATLEVSSIPVRDGDGRVTSVVYIAEDISERLGFEQQLRQAQKMESLGVLAGGIAHDFNNILTAVLGFTEIAIRKTRHDESLSNDLLEVYQASIRARDLVSQILTFSRRIEKELQPLDISIIIREALKLLRATLPTTIQMDLRVDRNLGPVLADPTQIHQVVINLCTNAAHAMRKEGGRLLISLRQIELDREQAARFHDLAAGQYIEFVVDDTGHGIPEEILPSIFDPYFTTKELGEGTGLGLSVVHGIVKEYGGDIMVRSQVGKGTAFTLLFPVSMQDKTEKVKPRTNAPPQPGKGQRILVVDDEPAILRLCRRLLETAGYEVETEADPRNALERIRRQPRRIDLLISDQTMPHLTGDRLASAVHETMPELPVILMSGNRATLSAPPASGSRLRIITKPIHPDQLLDEIGQLLADGSSQENQPPAPDQQAH